MSAAGAIGAYPVAYVLNGEGTSNLVYVWCVNMLGGHVTSPNCLRVEKQSLLWYQNLCRLNDPINGTVTVTIEPKIYVGSPANSSDAFNISTTTLTFTPDNYSQNQTISVQSMRTAHSD